jgi:hypothetical protein
VHCWCQWSHVCVCVFFFFFSKWYFSNFLSFSINADFMQVYVVGADGHVGSYYWWFVWVFFFFLQSVVDSLVVFLFVVLH